MSAWIATALAVAITAISPITVVNAGSCAPGSTPNCFNIPATIDFSSVPEISKQIVGEAKSGERQPQSTVEPPASAPLYRPNIWGKSATGTGADHWLIGVIEAAGLQGL